MKTLAAVMCVVLASAPAYADPPNLIAYEGVLMLDNQQVPNGVRAVTFELYADERDPNAIYTETQDVSFVNGRFSVLLGDQAPLNPEIFNVPVVFIGIRIGDTRLAGRQRIVPVPYALWTARADDLIVYGDVDIDGNVQMDSNLNVTQDLTVQGNARLTGPTVNVANDLTVNDTVQIGGTTTMSNVDIQGNAQVAGTVTAPAVVVDGRRIRGMRYSGLNTAASARFPNSQGVEITGFEAGGRITQDIGACFLTGTSTTEGRGACLVRLQGGVWVIISQPSEGTLYCEATCVIWDRLP